MNKLFRTVFLLLFCFMFVLNVSKSYAVDLEAGDWKFGINGFLDFEYTYMDKMPMVMASTGNLKKGPDTSTFTMEHLNLLFGAEREKARVNINIHSHKTFSSEDGETKGAFRFEEVYGIYSFQDHLKLQVGYMLTPFGIYNDVKYILPLFSSVVLPQMYSMPNNYASGSDSVSKDIMPEHSNVMILGQYSMDTVDIDYNVYASNGSINDHGNDANKNKGFGTRLKASFFEDYVFGVSLYTVTNDRDDIGKDERVGFDVSLNLTEFLKLESEYVYNSFGKRDDRYSYYVRLTVNFDKFTPFLGYDYVKDKGNDIFKRGQSRYSFGSDYDLSDYVMLKAGYHLHEFNEKDLAPVLPTGTDVIHMFKTAMIFIF